MLNDIKGFYDVVNYFIKSNYKKIVLIEGNKEFEFSLYRKKGYI